MRRRRAQTRLLPRRDGQEALWSLTTPVARPVLALTMTAPQHVHKRLLRPVGAVVHVDAVAEELLGSSQRVRALLMRTVQQRAARRLLVLTLVPLARQLQLRHRPPAAAAEGAGVSAALQHRYRHQPPSSSSSLFNRSRPRRSSLCRTQRSLR